MLCTHCKKEQATLFYTQNINGKEASAALCPACAKNAGIGSTGLFSPLFSSHTQKEAKRVPSKRCNLCGLQWTDILSMGKVGCPTCYNTFRTELEDTIRSIHGGAKHFMKQAPTKIEKNEPSEEEKLRFALAQAIETENYEEAARIRDILKAQKGENA